MAEQRPTGGLKWVRDELLTNLERIGKQVRADGDISDAVSLLFEMRAVLMALPLPTAAMLVEEMQRTCEQILKAATADAEQARQSVSLAAVQLEDHLRGNDSGEHQDPLALLASINDLRHSRGVSPISAAELLIPASVLTQGEQVEADSMGALVRLALKVRPHFHRYLVRWFSGTDPHEGLLGLSRLFNHMRRYFKQGPVHELFLAAEAVVDGLLDGQLEADAPTKALVGRVDKVLKPLTAPTPEWPIDIALALVSDLLARIAQMPKSIPAVQELERALGRRLTDTDSLDLLSPSIDGETAPMLDALRRELDDIAAPLLGLAQGTANPADVAAMPRRLGRLAESLSAVNHEAAAQRVRHCAEALDLEVRAGLQDEGRIGDVLRALRLVDGELANYAELAASPPSAVPQRNAPRAQDDIASTLREARNALSEARSAIGTGPMEPTRIDPIDDAYRALQSLAGTLRGIGESEPARLLDGLAAQLRIRYLGPGQVPGEAGVELIGRALAAVDIHLEDRIERDVTDVRMIAEADYAIERLSGLLRPDEETEGDSEASDSLPWSEASQSVNMEFLNLFLDEAQDELETIRMQHERWSRDRNDDVALSVLKRGFQTLKNSGSLVGARHLADLSRSTAAVLERLLDHELPIDVTVPDFLADVVALLPEIIDAESQRRKAPTGELMRTAKALLAAEPGRGKVIQMRLPPRDGATRPTQTDQADRAPRAPGDTRHPTVTEQHPAPLGTAEPLPELDPEPVPATPPDGTWETAQHPMGDGGEDAPAAAGDELEVGVDVDPDDELAALLDGDDLIGVFAEEAEELIDALEQQLTGWATRPPAADELALARRRLHTLKGSARMAGLAPVGDLAHALESLLAGAERMPAAALTRIPALAQQALDALANQIVAARQGAPIELPSALLAAIAAQSLDDEPAPGLSPQPAPAADAPSGTDATASTPPATGTEDESTMLRIDADWLDDVITASGEVGAYRARLLQQNARLGFRLAQLDDAVKRAARRVGTASDALAEQASGDQHQAPETAEPRKVLGETATLLDEARNITTAIGDMQRDNADLLRQQMRISEALQDDLLQARMLPVGRIESRLARLVRFVAQGTGKQAALALQGGEVQLDRRVLERFIAPLEHLLRNAVVHGIEPPALRRERGKPEVGNITIAVGREGNDVVLDVSDDGAGMDLARLRQRAVAQGLIPATATPSAEELYALTLRAGFSTAAEVSQEAGRGVGLDVVNTQVRSLNGELLMSSEPGRGTRFRVRLPLTLSIVEALLVSAADTLLAVPHGTALAVARVERERLEAGDASVEYRGERFPVEPIERALNPSATSMPPRRRWLPLLLVAAGSERVAFQVDAVHDSQRVVVKPIGPPLAALRWLSGGTVLPDGKVALVADLPALLRGMRQHGDMPRASDKRPRVLVVDDSETVRRLAARLLGRENMDVVTARDGVDAQVMLRSRQPDLLLVDLDMPRMNGLELTRWVRDSDDLRRLPVVMITSMAGETERAEALAAGVDRFVAKPFAEEELLAQIDALLHPIGD